MAEKSDNPLLNILEKRIAQQQRIVDAASIGSRQYEEADKELRRLINERWETLDERSDDE